jgi:hypothetical protein
LKEKSKLESQTNHSPTANQELYRWTAEETRSRQTLRTTREQQKKLSREPVPERTQISRLRLGEPMLKTRAAGVDAPSRAGELITQAGPHAKTKLAGKTSHAWESKTRQ